MPEVPRDMPSSETGERLDLDALLDLDGVSSDTDDDVSIAHLHFLYIFFTLVLLIHGSIVVQFSIALNSRAFPKIPIDIDSFGELDASITPTNPVVVRPEILVQPQGACLKFSFFFFTLFCVISPI